MLQTHLMNPCPTEWLLNQMFVALSLMLGVFEALRKVLELGLNVQQLPKRLELGT